jgi:hypothetical protein
VYDKREGLIRAASDANDRMLEYAKAVADGRTKPDRDLADALARECEETFKAWMTASGELIVH